MTTVSGWWFGPANDKLLHGDGRVAKVGRTHRVKGKLVPCENALHMTERAIDALRNAGGPILWRVEGSGKIIDQGDGILACRSRKYLARTDATTTVLAWARRCASDVLELWEAPEAVRHFLATGEDADAARAAAYSTAYAALYASYSASSAPAAHAAHAAYAAYTAYAARTARTATYASCAARTATYASCAARTATYATARAKYATWLEDDCTALVNI